MGGFFEQLSIVSLAVVACVVIARLTRGLGMVSGVAYLLLGILIGFTGVLPSLSPYAPLTGTGAAALMSMLLFVSGYSTNLQGTRRLWPRAALLGIGATLITIAAVGACLHLLLGVSLPVAVVVACAVGCTDIASVIGTLRGHGLTLRRDPAIMVELESGLSAPTSFVVLNVAMLFLGTSAPDEGWLALPQQIGQSALALVITLAAGLVIAALAIWAAKLLDRHGGQTGPAFITAVALISVALPESMGGSGCLCAWFVGLALGNARLEGTHQVVHFFDGLTFLARGGGPRRVSAPWSMRRTCSPACRSRCSCSPSPASWHARLPPCCAWRAARSRGPSDCSCRCSRPAAPRRCALRSSPSRARAAPT